MTGDTLKSVQSEWRIASVTTRTIIDPSPVLPPTSFAPGDASLRGWAPLPPPSRPQLSSFCRKPLNRHAPNHQLTQTRIVGLTQYAKHILFPDPTAPNNPTRTPNAPGKPTAKHPRAPHPPLCPSSTPLFLFTPSSRSRPPNADACIEIAKKTHTGRKSKLEGRNGM